MCRGIIQAIAIALIITSVKAHITYWNTPGQLQPVHGLYVKPSADGVTGDLYVAATEESGTSAQWLSDKPLNLLPLTTASHAHQTVPLSYTSNLALELPSATHKRAAIASPNVKYAYAIPTAVDGSTTAAYPYTVVPAAPTTVEETSTTQTGTEVATPVSSIPQYYPYSYFYPQMMSTAFMNAVSSTKESTGANEGTVLPTQGTAMWSPYSYPFQYVMVDPSSWMQSLSATATAPATTTSVPAPVKENESTQ